MPQATQEIRTEILFSSVRQIYVKEKQDAELNLEYYIYTEDTRVHMKQLLPIPEQNFPLTFDFPLQL